MAAVLKKLRTEFVDNVSEEIIKQLTDNLLDDKVLNSGEVAAILKKDLTPADQARKLIDAVIRKGDKASKKLIFYLQKRDPSFYEDLCQTCGIAVKTAAQDALGHQDQHDGPSTSANPPKNLEDKYLVTSKSFKNRVALLITNITFANKYHDRPGAEKDEENMEKLLSTLGYEVVKHTNLTSKQMDEALIQFSKHPKLKDTDSVFVVLMSHGKRGAVLGVNFKKQYSPDEEPDELPVDNIFRHLNADNCPALVDKPKVIIIQACRGGQRGSANVETDDAGGDIEEDVWRCVHIEKDFTALLSSTPDTVSYRDKLRGSFLIQFIVKVFNDYARQDDIDELFRKVMKKFEEEKEIPPQYKQMPTKDRCSLTKRFYLYAF